MMNGRTMAAIVGASILSGFCGGAALVAGLALSPQITHRLLPSPARGSLTVDTVTAHRFVLVGHKESILATLASWNDGSAGLVFLAPGQKFEKNKSSGFWSAFSTVADYLRLKAAAGIVVGPQFRADPEDRRAEVFVNASEKGRLTGHAGVTAEPESSTVTVWQLTGPVVKVSAVRSPKSARVELSPETSGAPPTGWTR